MDGLQSRDSFVLGYHHGTGAKVEVGGWVLVHIRGAQTTHTGSPSSTDLVMWCGTGNVTSGDEYVNGCKRM